MCEHTPIEQLLDLGHEPSAGEMQPEPPSSRVLTELIGYMDRDGVTTHMHPLENEQCTVQDGSISVAEFRYGQRSVY